MSKNLLQKNTVFLLTWLPVVLLVCSLLFYIVLHTHANHMQEKQLLLKQANVWDAFTTASGNFETHLPGEYDITPGFLSATISPGEPRDTILFYPGWKTSLPFQALSSQMDWNGKPYIITTYSSSREVTHLTIKVFLSEALILALLLISIVILNRKSSGILWRPFFNSLEKAREYDITKNTSLSLPEVTGTIEFDDLNKELNTLTANANHAYHIQKQFVENASHEMQTPLAIIRSKLELLINQPGLTEKSAALLADITEANEKLSQMNRTLLLLAKIENNQFPEVSAIDIGHELVVLVNNLKNHYEDFPQLTMMNDGAAIVTANKSLIQILLSNLLNNAVVHNISHGQIKLSISPNQLNIENTGPPLENDARQLFARFKKDSHHSKTTGLGLSLVKQICNLYGYAIKYTFSDGWHSIALTFV